MLLAWSRKGEVANQHVQLLSGGWRRPSLGALRVLCTVTTQATTLDGGDDQQHVRMFLLAAWQHEERVTKSWAIHFLTELS
jgi:hypothetical protein